MSLTIENDLSRPGGGWAILRSGSAPASIAVEDLSTGLFLDAAGKWTKVRHFFGTPAIEAGPGAVSLGPSIVDPIHADTILAIHLLDGSVLGKVIWPDIRPSARAGSGRVLPVSGDTEANAVPFNYSKGQKQPNIGCTKSPASELELTLSSAADKLPSMQRMPGNKALAGPWLRGIGVIAMIAVLLLLAYRMTPEFKASIATDGKQRNLPADHGNFPPSAEASKSESQATAGLRQQLEPRKLPQGAEMIVRNQCYLSGFFPQNEFTSVAFTPDGRFGLSGGVDGKLRLWDLMNGKQVMRLEGHEDRITSIAVSSNGRFALSGSDDRTLRLWDITTGIEIRRLTGHEDRVRSVAFSLDGRFALSGGYDRTLRLWDVANGTTIRRFTGHTDDVNSVGFSRDGRFAVSGGDDKIIRLWDIETGREVRRFVAHEGSIYSVGVSPDGLVALSTENDPDGGQKTRVWIFNSGKELGRYDYRSFAAFSPDGRTALSADESALKLWNFWTGEEVRSLEGHHGRLNAAIFSPNGRFALSAGSDGTLRLWDIASGIWRLALTAKEPCESDSSQGWAAFTPEGLYVAEGDVSKLLKVSGAEGQEGMALSKQDFLARNRRESLTEALSVGR